MNDRIVLMADDDPDDCILAREAFSETGANVAFVCVEDGVQLMDYLLANSHSVSKDLPALILLDLNMPLKDGRQALLEMKSNSTLQHIPVVILTTSEEPKDMALTLKAGAKTFITKPTTYTGWIEMMQSLVANLLI